MSNHSGLMSAMEEGLNVGDARPYLALARLIGSTEEDVIRDIRELKNEGKIKRFGLIVKNRSVGYVHNAMVTLDVPDEEVDAIGRAAAAFPFVRLCYQRQRILPEWPYNLYFMIHGKSRKVVEGQIEQIRNELHLQNTKMKILFSVKCFKQKGASYY